MNRKSTRGILMFGLAVSAAFAAWAWFRPYQWSAPEEARCQVIGCQVKQDRSNFWLDVHLEMNRGESHDLMMPVLLQTGAGREIEPADTTIGGTPGEGTSELWYKFWLEKEDMEGELHLAIHEGRLSIRGKTGIPDLGVDGVRYFTTNDW